MYWCRFHHGAIYITDVITLTPSPTPGHDNAPLPQTDKRIEHVVIRIGQPLASSMPPEVNTSWPSAKPARGVCLWVFSDEGLSYYKHAVASHRGRINTSPHPWVGTRRAAFIPMQAAPVRPPILQGKPLPPGSFHLLLLTTQIPHKKSHSLYFGGA